MTNSNKVLCTMGVLTLALGITCGVCADLGFYGTAWACGMLAVMCLLMAAPAAELVDGDG